MAPLTQTSSLTRTVFPIRPFPDNDVKKPGMFVFKDWEDYQKNGKNVDAKYMLGRKEKPGEQHHGMCGIRSSERVS